MNTSGCLNGKIQFRIFFFNDGRIMETRSKMRRSLSLLPVKDAQAGAGKGSIYQHSCPACGGPVKNMLDINSSYCGSLLNSTALDWVVSALMSRSASADENITPQERKILGWVKSNYIDIKA
jgi:hypothetical protein